MDVLEQVFGVRKPVIAMLHFPGLPGAAARSERGRQRCAVDLIGRDLEALGGVDGMLFCNEADIPYQLDVGPEIPAMAAVIGQVRRDLEAPSASTSCGMRRRVLRWLGRPGRRSSARC